MSTAAIRRKAAHGPFDDLKEFIGICAKARKELDPEHIKANVGKKIGDFVDGLDEDSKDFLTDIARRIRRPR